jgi:uncharacterized repeat protein (TIGR01451 family)
MRHGSRTWATLVAAIATAAAVPTTASAQSQPPSPGGGAVAPNPSRFVRNRDDASPPRPVPGIKNYHEELFGGAAPSAVAGNPATPPATSPAAAPGSVVPASAQTVQKPAPRTLPAQPVADQPTEQPAAPAFRFEPAAAPRMAEQPAPRAVAPPALRRDAAVRTVDFSEFDPASARDADVANQPIGGAAPSRVVQAAFEQGENEPAHGTIQPVGGEVLAADAVTTEPVPAEPFGAETISAGANAAEAQPKPSTLTITPVVGGPEAAAVGPQSPALTLEWVKQTDVNVGEECVVDLTIANTGGITAYDVLVEAYFPNTLRLIATEPRAAENRDSLSWSFPRIGTEETKTIRVTFVPSQRGELATRAHVRFTGAAATLFDVEEPMLKLAIQGPTEVHIGEPASQIVTVSNPGTGVARGVVLEARLPEGLEHPRGNKLVTEIGALNPGESRQVRLTLTAAAGGNQTVLVSAEGSGNLKQTTQASVTVVAPSIGIQIVGPKLRYLGRAADYQLVVVNDGSAPTDNVRVVHQVPAGFEFVSADRSGKYAPSTRQISWFVGRIEPGKQLALSSRLEPKTTGDHEHRVGAISEQGARGESSLVTKVDSAAELVLEIIDVNDPVEVGVETEYKLNIRNDGSKAAAGVGISCELPTGVEFVSAIGPAQHVAEGGIVVFKSLDTLPPGKTAQYRIMVKGTVDGNHRFRARLASESITEPLIIEELTKFYGE